jgi:hypothetical protein
MATRAEKQQLIDTLKFTPKTYRIEMGAYGGEVYMGTVDRQVYDFFKKHRISMDEYASDWDDDKWEFVPEELRPFSPGSPYDCDNLCHAAGATMDDSNMVTVYNENDKVVWECVLDPGALEDVGVEADCWEEAYIDQQPEGTVVFWGGQGEKGLCYGGSFELRAPFDPKQLKINYADCDGWLICNGVEYAGEEICNDDLSTTGKWGENKWVIAGDEEVYEGIDREDAEDEENLDIDINKHGIDPEVSAWPTVHETNTDDPVDFPKSACTSEAEFDDDQKTDWIPAKIKPVHVGTYECQVNKIPTWPWPNEAMLTWTGKHWQDEDGEKVGKPFAWRGLKEPAL